MMRNKHSGKVLDGRYEILSLLDEGGMGAVYLGRHVKLGRSVAVKFLHGELSGMKDVVTRFYREAQAASGISHPNIIDVLDVGVADWGEPYLVMEYLSGENLADLLNRKGPISLAAACGIMEPALRALYAAHERGIVHRDLKPENIFLLRQEDGPPVIKVIDFGISKFLETDQTKLTRTGALLGTPSYMSPEQARGKGSFDHRADIYSMGVVLYKMLCGRLPFVGESYNDLIVNILTEPATTPTEAYPDFPVDAESIVMRLLDKDPEKRFGTCMELLEALTSLEAFAGRQEALRELTADMPEERFATGDLGEAVEYSDETAATLYAGMGENGVTTVQEGVPTVQDKLPGEERKPAERPSGPAKPSTPRPERRDRRWVGLLLLVVLVVVGIGVGLYTTGVLSALWSAQVDSDDTPPVVPLEVPLTNSSVTEKDSAVVAPPNKEGEASSVAPEVSGAGQDGTDGNLASETEDGPADESPVESVTMAESGAVAAAVPVNNPANLPTDAPETQRAGEPAESVAPSEASTAEHSESADEDLSPLTPIAVNQLLEARRGKVMACYDIARAKQPELTGILELKVGMAGVAVNATVTGGDVPGFLSQCVIRVIKSISVPPNDGTLVEILKEYEFR